MKVNGQQITKSRNLITDSGHIEMTKDIVSVVVGGFMFNSLMIFLLKRRYVHRLSMYLFWLILTENPAAVFINLIPSFHEAIRCHQHSEYFSFQAKKKKKLYLTFRERCKLRQKTCFSPFLWTKKSGEWKKLRKRREKKLAVH